MIKLVEAAGVEPAAN